MINRKLRMLVITIVIFTVLVALVLPTTVEGGSPYIISDHRVKNLDVTPYIGRGYSIMANTYHSICIGAEETPVPSYNYDYSFYDFTNSTDVVSDVRTKMAYSLATDTMNRKITATKTTNTKTDTKVRFITSSMRIERYYTSIREDQSTLSDDALTLLNRQDYIGFFTACGPSYIRGVRRAQEVVATFSFESVDEDQTTSFAKEIKTSSWKNKVNIWYTTRQTGVSRKCKWWDVACKLKEADIKTDVQTSGYVTKSSKEQQTLKIDIQGFGLGLNSEGSETLIATSLLDHHRIMVFAFNTMTRVEDFAHIGMVYGVEVVNWVENIQFQAAASIQDEVIEIPLSLSLIPRSYRLDSDGNQRFDYTNASAGEKEDFICKDSAAVIDKFGFCCVNEELYNLGTNEYSSDFPEEGVCRPIRALDPSMLKENMSTNAEFVARLQQLVRYKVNLLSLVERCISAILEFPERYNFYNLKPNHKGIVKMQTSALEMKMVLDPLGDLSLVTHLGQEFDEFMDMFIRPCYSALFGSSFGDANDEDVSYFMAYPWYFHDACSKLSCMASGMRWDRDDPNGGCVPSISKGQLAAMYNENNSNSNCGKELVPKSPTASAIECKHKSETLNKRMTVFQKAWTNFGNIGNLEPYMEAFCMPEIENKQLSRTQTESLKKKHIAFKAWYENKLHGTVIPTDTSTNIALNKPASSGSIYLFNLPSKAVDGNRDGMKHRSSTFISQHGKNAWWHVDLLADYTVTEVRVYNRQDCCSQRLSNAKVDMYDANDNHISHSTRQLTANYENIIDYSHEPIQHVRKVKVHFDGVADYLQLAEVEVYASLPINNILA